MFKGKAFDGSTVEGDVYAWHGKAYYFINVDGLPLVGEYRDTMFQARRAAVADLRWARRYGKDAFAPSILEKLEEERFARDSGDF